MTSGSLISVNAIYITANAATRCSTITLNQVSMCDTNDISKNKSHTVWGKVTTETFRDLQYPTYLQVHI